MRKWADVRQKSRGVTIRDRKGSFIMELLICALRNLGRKKLRTALTVAGIAIGVAAIIVIEAIGSGGRLAVSQQMDSLGINGLNITAKKTVTGAQSTLDLNDVADCMKVDGVTKAMPMNMQMGSSLFHGYEKDILAWGIGPDARQIISMKLSYGKGITQSDVDSHALVCLVDDSFAKEAYKRANITGTHIVLYLGSGYHEVEVKGVVTAGSSILYNLAGEYIPSFVYLPYTTAQDLRGKTGFDEIAVKTASNRDIDEVGDSIVDALSLRHNDEVFAASNMFKQKQKLNNLLRVVTLIISAVGAISMVVAGLGIMTMMTVSVSERTREIGIKKAIGAKKRIILLEFLFEALAISLFGGLCGVAGGVGISLLASWLLHFSFQLEISSLLISTGLSVLIGVVFGVYPASKAANLRPVDALRQE